MSNFDILNKSSLLKLIEPFAKGMTDHITPIKYEAITPDVFALLFRTTGENADGLLKDHYFVSLEFDYIENLQTAKELIERWHGSKVIDFLPPEVSPDSEDPRIKIDEAYQALLAKVERPQGTGYWANNEVILSPDAIEDFVLKYEGVVQESVRRSLVKIFNDFPGVSVSVYVHADGSVEYFYS